MPARSTAQLVLVLAGLGLLVEGVILSSTHPAGPMTGPLDELGRLALGLAILVTAALAGGHVAVHFGQPAVLGELLAGIVLGSLAGAAHIQFLGVDPYLGVFAQVGMLLLLFDVGLELSVRDLFAVASSSSLVAVIGTASSLAIGAGASALLNPEAPLMRHVFLGAAITATSVGITARVLKDMGAMRSPEAKIILGAAVVDDVLALVVLGGVMAWIGTAENAGGSGAVTVVALVMKTAGFLVLAVVLGIKLTPAWFHLAARLRTRGALLVAGLCFCFFLSWAASAIGLAALVGAFAAGLVLEDAHSSVFVQRGEPSLGQLLQPMIAFLVPLFFVLVGFRTSLGSLGPPAQLLLPVALVAAAVLGKLSCAAGVLGGDARPMTVAAGMLPRGEVTLVFAALGSTIFIGGLPLLDEGSYTALVAVVILTTLVTPPALKWSLKLKRGARGVTKPAA